MKKIEPFVFHPAPVSQELTVDPDDMAKEVEASAIVIGGTTEIEIPDLDLRRIQQLLYVHPVIPRGIEIKANRMVGRGYNIKSPHEEARLYCEKILAESGDAVFLKRIVEDTYAFGNSFSELIHNKAGNEVLRVDILHPIYFGFAKQREAPADREDIESSDKLYVIFDERTQKPIGYQEYRYINNELTPHGEILELDRVIHLAFDRWGDEVEGVSIVKYLVNILQYILNIESAAAEAGFRSANPRYKFTTNIRSADQLQEFAAMVADINERDSVILTEGNDVDVLNPGTTNFEEYHDRFINLLAVRLGIPKPLLLMDGTSTNKATLREQTDFLRNENAADERVVSRAVTHQIFGPACRLRFGENFLDENIPVFEFNQHVDSEDTLVERLKEQSLSIINLTNAGLALLNSGLAEEAKNVFSLIPKQDGYDETQATSEFDEFQDETSDKTTPTTSTAPVVEPVSNQNAGDALNESDTEDTEQ